MKGSPRALLPVSLLALPLFTAPSWCRPDPSDVVAPEDAGPAENAASDLSPAKKPPPVRLPHPPVPALPDLPALSAHEVPASAPLHLPTDDTPCKAVWTGSEATPVGCARSLLFGGEGGATLLVPRSLLARDPSVLPAVVDHRLDGTEGPLRDQAKAPACTAFATAAAIDHALARWGGKNPAVSVMQIWSRYHSPYEETSLASNIGQPLGAEEEWPFSANEAIAWIPCGEFAKAPRGGCGKPVDERRIERLATRAVGEFTEVEYLGTEPDVSMLEAKLASGQDVIVAMELPSAFVPKGRPGARYIPNYTKSAGPGTAHALVLAGYARFAHGAYFLAHNSWGPQWGDKGYAWIHETTLRTWTRQTVAVDAEPVDRTPESRPQRKRGELSCPGSLVRDSIRGTCSPACPDKSPRHDGVCPVAGQCAASYVNLTGACVLAAPSVSGRDPDTDIAWTCGAGGCSYELPRASDPSCTGGSCRASCPAPDFHLAKMGKALVCVE